MDCEHQACAECTRKCILLHQKGKSLTSSVSSFFKVMIGERLSKALFLPPKFARMVTGLIDKQTLLEDSNGLQWKVKLSNVRGSIAFQEGWNSFASDHGLDIGYFLVFCYITGSHFVVHVYDTTGCEKMDFPKTRNREKGAETNGSLTANDDQCCTRDKTVRNNCVSSNSYFGRSDAKTGRGQRQGNNSDKATVVTEKLSRNEIAIGRPQDGSKELDNKIMQDIGDKEAGSLRATFGLPNLETLADKSGADGRKKVIDRNGQCPFQNNSSLVSQNEVGLGNIKSLGSGASVNDMMEDDSEENDKLISVSHRDSCKNYWRQSKRSELQQEKISKEGFHLCDRVLKTCQITAGTYKSKSSKKKPKGIESKQVQSPYSSFGSHNKPFKVVKLEASDEDGLPSPTAGSISCLIAVNSKPFLESPAALPSVSWKRNKTERRVVLLRGPDKRLWPVLYQETFAFKILTSGWEAFSKANNIEPGDERILQLENETEGIFQVQDVCKQRG